MEKMAVSYPVHILKVLCLLWFVGGFLFACKEKAAKAPEPVVVKEVIKETKTGLASFYGPGLEGKKTAGGEIFRSADMVAAHPTYSLGTIVRITNLSTQDTVVVRIADRGPTRRNQREGIIIDLSKGAASKINMIAAGRAKVRVDVLEWGQGTGDADSTK